MNDASRKKDPERNKEEERRILKLWIRKKKEEIIQKSKSKHSPMWRHDKESHGGRHQQYYARILTREKSVFPLSLTEGLYIDA